MGGNLCDAVSMAVKAALHSTRIPVVRVTAVDGGEPEIEVGMEPLEPNLPNDIPLGIDYRLLSLDYNRS